MPSSLRPASWPNSLLAACLIAIVLGAWATSMPAAVSPQLIAGGIVTLVPFCLIPWRPRIPGLLLCAAIVAEIIAALLGVYGGADVVAIVAVYTIAAEKTLRAALAAMAATVAGAATAGFVEMGTREPLNQIAGAAVIALVCLAVIAMGRYMARRRAYVRNLVVRTEQLEREREQLAREAVATERARIARELHDVIAHHVSVMVLQAGAAQATLPPGADGAAQSLEAIRQTGREAMAEMRRLLGLLRSEESLEADDPDRAPAPQPGLADLEALAERTREAGLLVDLEVDRSANLPAGVDLSAYRIVQEALTNTLRHAGAGTRVHVAVECEPGELVVEIADDGRKRETGVERGRRATGHGLVGMRERVALFGGSLLAGPRPEGGYRVVARFPLDDGEGTAR